MQKEQQRIEKLKNKAFTIQTNSTIQMLDDKIIQKKRSFEVTSNIMGVTKNLFR